MGVLDKINRNLKRKENWEKMLKEYPMPKL